MPARSTLAPLFGLLGLIIGFGIARFTIQRGNPHVILEYGEQGNVTSLARKQDSSSSKLNWMTYWYDTGEISSQVEFQGTRPTGRARFWNESGRLRAIQSGNIATTLSTESFDETGRRVSIATRSLSDPCARWQVFDKRGAISAEFEFERARKHGESLVFYPDGTVACRGEYWQGERWGSWSYFAQDGTECSEADLPAEIRRAYLEK